MKTLLKKSLLVLISLCLFNFTFAQEVPESANLTDADLKAYCKNYDKIMATLDDFNIDENATNVESNAEFEKLDKKLGKLGLTGENKLGKIYAINACYSQEVLTRSLSQDRIGKSVLNSYDTNVSSTVNPDDMKIVQKYYEQIAKASGDEVISKEDTGDETFGDVVADEVEKAVKEEIKNQAREDAKNATRDLLNGLKKSGFPF